ncbi:MAG: hypothetical protein U1E67_17445 [Hyphomicrobiales bacterium]
MRFTVRLWRGATLVDGLHFHDRNAADQHAQEQYSRLAGRCGPLKVEVVDDRGVVFYQLEHFPRSAGDLTMLPPVQTSSEVTPMNVLKRRAASG